MEKNCVFNVLVLARKVFDVMTELNFFVWL